MSSSQPHGGSSGTVAGCTSCSGPPFSPGFLPVHPNFGCLSGFVNLFQFIQPPAPGTIIGTLTGFQGFSLPLVQTHPTPPGGIPLAAVDRQFATLCGNLVTAGGRLALDVQFVFPFFSFAPGFGPFSPGFGGFGPGFGGPFPGLDPFFQQSLAGFGI